MERLVKRNKIWAQISKISIATTVLLEICFVFQLLVVPLPSSSRIIPMTWNTIWPKMCWELPKCSNWNCVCVLGPTEKNFESVSVVQIDHQSTNFMHTNFLQVQKWKVKQKCHAQKDALNIWHSWRVLKLSSPAAGKFGIWSPPLRRPNVPGGSRVRLRRQRWPLDGVVARCPKFGPRSRCASRSSRGRRTLRPLLSMGIHPTKETRRCGRPMIWRDGPKIEIFTFDWKIFKIVSFLGKGKKLVRQIR